MAQKPWLNRRETQTLLTTLKMTAAAGTLSLTIAGWGLLARTDMKHAPQAELAANTTAGPTARLSAPPTPVSVKPVFPTPTPVPAKASASQTAIHLNVVQWTRSANGEAIAIVKDRRGRLWYVMGSDIPKIEQGLQPQFQPQPVRVVTRSRSS